MQLILKQLSSCKVVELSEDKTVFDLEQLISKMYSLPEYSLYKTSSTRVSDVYSNMQTINVTVPVRGGGRELPEELLVICLERMKKTMVCRKCYATKRTDKKENVTCRKRGCGNCGDMRPKKWTKTSN
ncbi:hypothetical protein A0H76_1427 [Hepatospora eriocheir]|uniref:Large ribosomal subunit protein eL40 domain-containing protein n=1 Tax=Hepatospora eriocheir TaxID=1081669 RepID=A0A1X0QH27_9MICR|nr:hypothetical protein A0H76_1427 [Hepatospora eriocheir]